MKPLSTIERTILRIILRVLHDFDLEMENDLRKFGDDEGCYEN